MEKNTIAEDVMDDNLDSNKGSQRKPQSAMKQRGMGKLEGFKLKEREKLYVRRANELRAKI